MLITAMLLAGGAVWAQTPAAGPTAADENKAYTAIFNAAKDPATQPADMEQMVNDYLKAGYPNPKVVPVEYLALHYYAAHNDLPHMLAWGEKILEKDPNNVPTMASLAAAIPAKWHDTDLDGDQRLAEAEGYDNKILQAMADLKVDTDGAVINGQKVTSAQADNFKNAYLATAYSSLGRIALDRKQYDVAVKNFKLATDKETSQANKSTEFFLLAMAQEDLKSYADATASLNQAAALAGSNANLQQAIQAEQAKVKKESGGSQ